MNKFTMRRGDDLHIHFREGVMLNNVVPITARHWARALVMPNTIPPITNGEEAWAYHGLIKGSLVRTDFLRDFRPLMTIKILPTTTPPTIEDAYARGIVSGKIYPEGVTTNSSDGVRDFKVLTPVFESMQEVGMVLCLHGELPGGFVLHREHQFLPTLNWLSKSFPRLKIVLEHITTAAAVETVRALPSNVGATITIHHLLITLHDLLCFKGEGGEFLNPHLYCKPVAKYPTDLEALRKAAFGGNSKFFYGGDSAPHLRINKERPRGCAGVFNAPVALPLLVELFEQEQQLDKLENFVSRFGAEFYGIPLNNDTITLEKKTWRVPEEYFGVVPFMAGKEISWSVCD